MVDPEANIIVGAVVDEALEGEIHVTVIATGFENNKSYRSEQSNRVSTNVLTSQVVEENGARIPEFLRRRQQETENQN